MIVLGYDPGGGKKDGKGQSGVGYLKKGVSFETAQCRSVAAAILWFRERCGGETPDAIGIDTFLHWSVVEKGWRPADLALRQAYPRCAKSVQPSNSTSGSMAVQGMALAIAMKNEWPSIILNEVHPKVLFAELANEPYPRTASEIDALARINFLKSRGHTCSGNLKCEDEFDAALCCIATCEGVIDHWPNLLDRNDLESLIFPTGRVCYLWPRALEKV
jgi:hypothetical protein